ncbi:MAG: malonyl-[acyl-carrier protein] O-methyltransferase BioC, partial [Xanthomonadaceae bacterium]|nr:malonyl-[acyl-carrier protein] O-methyltransferase BioC [Xanthomonadaceae bacterium]
MNSIFDYRHIRRAFSRAAPGYAGAAALSQEVQTRLLESLDYLDDKAPQTVLDIGNAESRAITRAFGQRLRKMALAYPGPQPM